MRLSDVPKPVLAAIILLCAAAVACGLVLHATGARGIVYARAQHDAVDLGVTVTPAEYDEDLPKDGSREGAERDDSPQGVEETIYVHVAGSVVSPGLYALEKNARVDDAITAAGGLADDADVEPINLAAPVSDGAKVTVPSLNSQAGSTGNFIEYVTNTESATDASGVPPKGKIDINTANAAELSTLSGIGESIAADIVRDREANGPFASAEDLMRVSGIGQKKFDKIADSIACS